MNVLALTSGLLLVCIGLAGAIGGRALWLMVRFVTGAAFSVVAGVLALVVCAIVAFEHVPVPNWSPTNWTPTLLMLAVVVVIVASYHRRSGLPSTTIEGHPSQAASRALATPAPASKRGLASPSRRPAIADATSALQNLGYSKTDAEAAVAVVLDQLATDADAPTIIKAALQGRTRA
jgi:hypothetical protein